MYKNMSTEKIIKTLRNHGFNNGATLGYHASWCDEAADRLEEYEEQCIAFCEILPTCEGCSGKTEEGVRTEDCVYAINNLYCMKRARENYFAMKAKVEELTEENERLKAVEFTCGFIKPHKVLECPIFDEIERTKADTVRKMHSEIKVRCIEGGIYPAFVARVIEDVASEMAEGETIEKCEKSTPKSIEKCETLEDLRTRFATHFGTYTDADVIKVRDVFKLIDRFSKEISEGEV